MDQTFNGNIEELVKTSKQLQNKMRQELRRQAMSSSLVAGCGERDELPPIWDKIMLNPYVTNVVADYLVDSPSLTTKSFEFEIPPDEEKPIKVKKSPTKETNGVDHQAKQSKVDSGKAVGKTVGTQVAENELWPQEVKEVNKMKLKSVNKAQTDRKSVRTQDSAARINDSDLRKKSKTSIKSSFSKHRLPLQRFAETPKGNADFSKEHPHLELDLSSNVRTLFPLRYPKGNKPGKPSKASQEYNSVNLAAASVKTRRPKLVVEDKKPETWKEVLQKNRTPEKICKVLRLKKSVEAVSVVHVPEIKELKVLDIISTPANGLFQLKKQDEWLSKQKKCNLQRFPVMYIRPEFQVQQVANICIRSASDTNRIRTKEDSYPANVKYVECKHEEAKQQLEVVPGRDEDDKAKVDDHKVVFKENAVVRKEDNKFFNALKFAEPLKQSPANNDSSTSTSKSSSKSQPVETSPSSTYSALKVQPSSSPSSVETPDSDVHHIFQELLSTSERMHSSTNKGFIRNLPTLREVCVQTDNKTSTATSPQPPPDLASPIISSPPNPIIHLPCSPSPPPAKQDDRNLNEDDIITKIFERIRNDVPHALQTFKDRDATPREEVPLEPHHQTSAISNNAPNIKLLPSVIESRLPSVQAKGQDIRHTPLKTPPPPVNLPDNTQSPPPRGRGDESKLLLVQNNPLFVPTINRIKPSAVYDDAMPTDGRVNEDRHRYPTDAQIKRAVQIFINSLTLEGGVGGNIGGSKSISKCGSVSKRPALPTRELIGAGRVSKYFSSTSNSSTSSSKDVIVNIRKPTNRSKVRSSPSSTVTYSSDSETESDVTLDQYFPPLAKNSLSEGEILSVGEV